MSNMGTWSRDDLRKLFGLDHKSIKYWEEHDRFNFISPDGVADVEALVEFLYLNPGSQNRLMPRELLAPKYQEMRDMLTETLAHYEYVMEHTRKDFFTMPELARILGITEGSVRLGLARANVRLNTKTRPYRVKTRGAVRFVTWYRSKHVVRNIFRVYDREDLSMFAYQPKPSNQG